MITIATKDIAKQVRKELKAAYPSIKFSVTSDWNKISVSYVDGVPQSEINPFVTKYIGYRNLDTYGDYGCDTTSQSVMFQEEEVDTNLKYYNVSRSFSERYMSEVLDYVKATLHDADTDGVAVEVSQWSGNAHFTGDYDSQSYYCEIARESSSLESIKVQRDRIRAAEDAEYQEWQARQEVKTAPISRCIELVITPVSIIDIPVDRKNVEVLDCKFPSGNKCQQLDEYIEQIEETAMHRAVINRIVQLTDADYDAWTQELLSSQEWLAEMGGSDSTAPLRDVENWWNYSEDEQKAYRAEAYNLSILVYAPNRSAILVNPQGYNYARYVGFIEEGLADRYLPKKIESAEPIQEPIAMSVQEPIEVYGGNIIAFPTAKPAIAEETPNKPTAIELYSKWVQDKISQGQAAKIIAFDDWLEIAMMALNAAIAL